MSVFIEMDNLVSVPVRVSSVCRAASTLDKEAPSDKATIRMHGLLLGFSSATVELFLVL